MNGGFSNWSDWGECDVSCGDGGTRTRVRSYDNPLPSTGGRYCQGETEPSEPCSGKFCLALESIAASNHTVGEILLKTKFGASITYKGTHIESKLGPQTNQLTIDHVLQVLSAQHTGAGPTGLIGVGAL